VGEVVLRKLTKRFGDVVAVDDVSLKIEDGEFVVLLGPSGCGKSTILRLIAGLEDATAGEIVIGDKLVNFVDPVQRNVAMVFQNYALYPHMTVFKNVAFPLQMARRPKDEITASVRGAAEILELSELLERYPDQLSGGQRQRVALARALFGDPALIVLDEPNSNLDEAGDAALIAALRTAKQEQRTVFVMTHRLNILNVVDAVAVLAGGVLRAYGAREAVLKKLPTVQEAA